MKGVEHQDQHRNTEVVHIINESRCGIGDENEGRGLYIMKRERECVHCKLDS